MAMLTAGTTLASWPCGSRLTLKVGRYRSGLGRYEDARWVICCLALSMQTPVVLRFSRVQVPFVFRNGAINRVCCLARSMQTSAALRFFRGPRLFVNGAVNVPFRPRLVTETSDFLSSYNTAHSTER